MPQTARIEQAADRALDPTSSFPPTHSPTTHPQPHTKYPQPGGVQEEEEARVCDSKLYCLSEKGRRQQPSQANVLLSKERVRPR